MSDKSSLMLYDIGLTNRLAGRVVVLEEEITYFQQNKNEWLKTIPGKFVLVKGSQLIGSYDTMQQALDEGSRSFGMSSFLIRRIEERSEEISIPALTLGIPFANPAYTNPGTA